MSGNAIARNGKMDRRIRRTRDRLGGAIMQLLQEKQFESITVQDVLDRAHVGRSTFYSHFRDRDDLFLSDVDEFYEHMAMALSSEAEPSDRVLPRWPARCCRCKHGGSTAAWSNHRPRWTSSITVWCGVEWIRPGSSGGRTIRAILEV